MSYDRDAQLLLAKGHNTLLSANLQAARARCTMSQLSNFLNCSVIFIRYMIRRRGRRRKKLLDELKDRRGYSHLKEENPDRTMWRNPFGGSFGPVVRQNTE